MPMVRHGRALLLVTAGVIAACGRGGRGSPACGLALNVAPSVILQRVTDQPAAVLRDVPRGLPDRMAARVIGYAQAHALVAYEGNKLVLGYEGHQFPTDTAVAFGLLVVDDTSQRVIGALIYPNSTVPRGNPLVGVVSDGNTTLGLYGVRVSWADLSNPRCPLLGDTAGTRADAR